MGNELTTVHPGGGARVIVDESFSKKIYNTTVRTQVAQKVPIQSALYKIGASITVVSRCLVSQLQHQAHFPSILQALLLHSPQQVRWLQHDTCIAHSVCNVHATTGTSAPAFSFGSAPAAASSSAFGFSAASTSAFGAAASTPAFGAAVPAASTPAFGAAASQPAFQWGAAAAAPGMFGATPAGALGNASQMASCLVTKDNKPITHTTQWDELAPQAQQQLLLLEAEVSKAATYCSQLEACPRLTQPQPQRQVPVPYMCHQGGRALLGRDQWCTTQVLEEEGQMLKAQLQGLQKSIDADADTVAGLRAVRPSVYCRVLPTCVC